MKKSKATEALRVATDVAAIRTALHQRGYQLRKQPKQPVWKVILTPDYFYKLSYQPAPISAWVLHPLSQRHPTPSTRNHHSKRHKKPTRKPDEEGRTLARLASQT